jgi:FkbM family methyltransferase
MSISNFIGMAIRRAGIDYLPKLVNVDFLGRHYTVRQGTVDHGDYDDAWMLALAHHSECVMDVGSNIGQSAFTMLHSPTIKALALVDPSPFALTIAVDTLTRCQMIDRVRLMNAFVCDELNQSVPIDARGHGTGATILGSDDADGIDSVQVPCMTIDAICERLGIEPDLVKIDVGGLEGRVLKGASALAMRQHTRMMIEMHATETRAQATVTQEALDWCRDVNYTPWYMKTGEELSSAQTVQGRGRYHLLLQPASFSYPTWLKRIQQGTRVDAALLTSIRADPR